MLHSIGLALLLALSTPQDTAPAEAPSNLLAARAGFETTLVKNLSVEGPLPKPELDGLSVATYESPLGTMAGWMSDPVSTSSKLPAIIWLSGGFPTGGVGDYLYGESDRSNDQSAQSFRENGVVTLYPGMRGTAGNPGKQELFFGEVDDVLAGLAYLQSLDFVDKERIYLGGHSTGGTLAMLVAAATADFKAVFAFGPCASVSAYGSDSMHHDPANAEETRLRSPIHFLSMIASPTFVIEGDSGNANLDSIRKMRGASENELVSFHAIKGATHFSVLKPLSDAIARRVALTRADRSLDITHKELQGSFDAVVKWNRESKDLRILSELRYRGVDMFRKHKAQHTIYSWDKAALESALAKLESAGWQGCEAIWIGEYTDRDGETYYEIKPIQVVVPSDLKAVFAVSAEVEGAMRGTAVYTAGWDVLWWR